MRCCSGCIERACRRFERRKVREAVRERLRDGDQATLRARAESAGQLLAQAQSRSRRPTYLLIQQLLARCLQALAALLDEAEALAHLAADALGRIALVDERVARRAVADNLSEVVAVEGVLLVLERGCQAREPVVELLGRRDRRACVGRGNRRKRVDGRRELVVVMMAPTGVLAARMKVVGGRRRP